MKMSNCSLIIILVEEKERRRIRVRLIKLLQCSFVVNIKASRAKIVLLYRTEFSAVAVQNPPKSTLRKYFLFRMFACER